MPIDFDAHIRLADLRTRINSGQDVSADEMRDVLLQLRQGRDAAATANRKAARAAAQPRTKPPKEVDLVELFGSISPKG